MKFELTEENDLQMRILEAVNYLLIKNKNFEFENDILYDRKEKIYYNIKTGKIIKRGIYKCIPK